MGIAKSLEHRPALRAWLDRHDGVVTTSQARALGVTKRGLDGMVDREEFVRVRRGLYRARGARWDLRAELRAALAQEGDPACLLLITGLHWQDLLLHPAGIPQLGVPGDGDVQRKNGRVVHKTPYARETVISFDGLQCLHPVPALVHLAGHVQDHGDVRVLRRAMREAIRRDQSAVAALGSWADRGGVRGTRDLRAALKSMPGAVVVRSDLEEDFIAFCEIWGLPPYLTNYVVEGKERDCVWLLQRVIAELDTRGFHANVIAMESDRQRRRKATAAGWKHVEITNLDLRDEAPALAADLANVLGLADWSPPADAAARWAEVIASAAGVWLPGR